MGISLSLRAQFMILIIDVLGSIRIRWRTSSYKYSFLINYPDYADKFSNTFPLLVICLLWTQSFPGPLGEFSSYMYVLGCDWLQSCQCDSIKLFLWCLLFFILVISFIFSITLRDLVLELAIVLKLPPVWNSQIKFEREGREMMYRYNYILLRLVDSFLTWGYRKRD